MKVTLHCPTNPTFINFNEKSQLELSERPSKTFVALIPSYTLVVEVRDFEFVKFAVGSEAEYCNRNEKNLLLPHN